MIYPYRCGDCGLVFERVCSLRSYETDPSYVCPHCGNSATRIFTPPRIFTKSFEPFRSPVDGTIITNSRELQEHNKRNNVVNLHDGYDETAVQGMIKKDLHNRPEAERLQDLNGDMKQAIQKLQEGYTPTPAPYTEEFPDA